MTNIFTVPRDNQTYKAIIFLETHLTKHLLCDI